MFLACSKSIQKIANACEWRITNLSNCIQVGFKMIVNKCINLELRLKNYLHNFQPRRNRYLNILLIKPY